MVEPIINLILDKVKILLTNTSLKLDDKLILIYCEQSYQEACGICNVKEMPEESINNIAFLAISSLIADSNQNIQSLSEGGRSVSFGNMTSADLRVKALSGLEKWKKVRCV